MITTPARIYHARKAIPATKSAVADASAANLEMSPPAIVPKEAPISREMAEVTVTTVLEELEKNQKNNPAAKQA